MRMLPSVMRALGVFVLGAASALAQDAPIEPAPTPAPASAEVPSGTAGGEVGAADAEAARAAAAVAAAAEALAVEARAAEAAAERAAAERDAIFTADLADGEVVAGSLWDEGFARVLIGMDGNARRVGDLITVQISETTRTEILADTETKRESSVAGSLGGLFGIGTGILNANTNMGSELGMSVEGSAEFKGDGKTRREGSLAGTLTCQVVEVKPNGNLVVYGWKEVRSNRETQYLVLTGTVRPRDVQADNTVESHLLAEAKIEFSGSGVVADKQGPGVGQRLTDHAWPF